MPPLLALPLPPPRIQAHPRKPPTRRGGQLIETLYRRLTVREALRVQSFPDWWRFPQDVSITAKFKLIGEAVPPILAYKIARHVAITMGWEWYPPRQEDFQLPYFERALQELLAVTQR
ncbi:DNA cytosine methyltransferase [Metallosphaera sp.]|uniref:DNA cytosine methyltransferase n=1 Tax=Metallosphaera sp. TaxID=2020860 RepID=UPI0038620BB1